VIPSVMVWQAPEPPELQPVVASPVGATNNVVLVTADALVDGQDSSPRAAMTQTVDTPIRRPRRDCGRGEASESRMSRMVSSEGSRPAARLSAWAKGEQ
jgi:hypothetical protein